QPEQVEVGMVLPVPPGDGGRAQERRGERGEGPHGPAERGAGGRRAYRAFVIGTGGAILTVQSDINRAKPVVYLPIERSPPALRTNVSNRKAGTLPSASRASRATRTNGAPGPETRCS